VQPKAHLPDAQARAVPLDLRDAMDRVAHDKAILAELLDGKVNGLARGQHIVLPPLGVGIVLGGNVGQRLAEGGVHVAGDVELSPQRRE
jgi:hypothetical protein